MSGRLIENIRPQNFAGDASDFCDLVDVLDWNLFPLPYSGMSKSELVSQSGEPACFLDSCFCDCVSHGKDVSPAKI